MKSEYIGQTVITLGLIAACVTCLVTGHETAAIWFGFFTFCAL